jgi:hypothetical protein
LRQANNPWMKFYPSDWRSDPMLRLCSLAARGLWAELICLMHEAKPYGSMLVNGKRINKVQMAALVGVPERECSTLILELEGAGVFSRDPDGTIYSRRMRRDHEKALKDKTNGQSGGNPKLKSKVDNEVKGWVNPPDNPTVEDGDKAQRPEVRDQKPETIDQKPEKEGPREVALVPSGWPADWFDQFWKKYPNKVNRAGAMKLLAKAGKKGIGWSIIMAGLDRYIAKTDDRPWCNPTTWINQSRWEEQHATVRSNNGFEIGNTRRAGHDAILASATRKARKLDQQDEMAWSENQIEPASRNDAHGGRTRGDGAAFGGDRDDHHGLEFDPGRMREGEIVAPDKNAARFPDLRRLV